MITPRLRRFAALTAGVLTLGLSAATVPGVPASATPAASLRLISGANPLPAAGTPGACGSSAEFQGWEQEPALAIDPANDANLVVAWMQDYSDAVITAFSSDAGRSWTTSIPKTTACTGGSPHYVANSSAFDPALSFGPADPLTGRRTVYLSTVLLSPNPNPDFGPLTYEVVVHRSTDGGRTWSDPVSVARSAGAEYLDGTSIVADPRRPGRAYVAWRQGDIAYGSRAQRVSRTEDGGATWSPGLPLAADEFQLSGRLHVLGDGTLVNLLSSIPAPPTGTPKNDVVGPTTLLAVRSSDLGTTWSPPVQIAVADESHATNVGSAVGPDGTLYAGWQRADGGTHSILLSSSTNGGRSWTSPSLVAMEAGRPLLDLFATPDIAVRADGTVGVGFYDHRNATASSPGISDYWLRTSRNGTGPWREHHVAGPFDASIAPLGFLGDYQGIVGRGKGFGMALSMTGPQVAGNPTDIVWATAH